MLPLIEGLVAITVVVCGVFAMLDGIGEVTVVRYERVVDGVSVNREGIVYVAGNVFMLFGEDIVIVGAVESIVIGWVIIVVDWLFVLVVVLRGVVGSVTINGFVVVGENILVEEVVGISFTAEDVKGKFVEDSGMINAVTDGVDKKFVYLDFDE